MNMKLEQSGGTRQPLPRLFWVTYSSTKPTVNSKDRWQHPKFSHVRDGAAFNELSHTAHLLSSYSYETFIHLYPAHRSRLNVFPQTTPRDLLVLATRPPLDDPAWEAWEKSSDQSKRSRVKPIFPSECDFENIIFSELRKYFDTCARTGVKLSKQGVGCLKTDADKWKEIEFDQFIHHGKHDLYGLVKRHVIRTGESKAPMSTEPPYTVGFLVRINNLPKLGCDLLVSFGMDGDGTLIWNRIIRTRHPELVIRPGFVMAKITFKREVPNRLITPGFVDDEESVGVEILTKKNNGA